MQLARNMNRTEIHSFNKYLWSIVFVQSTEVNICWKIISFTSKRTSAIFQVQFHWSIRQLRQLRHKGTFTKRIFFFFWIAKTGWYLLVSKLDSIVCEKEGERETDWMTEEHFLEKAKISLRQNGRQTMLIPELQWRGEPEGFVRNNTTDVLGPEDLNQMPQGSAPGISPQGCAAAPGHQVVLLKTRVWGLWHQALGPREPFCTKTSRKMHQSPAHGKHRQAYQYSTPKWTPKLYLESDEVI